jgi:hypothetical protein
LSESAAVSAASALSDSGHYANCDGFRDTRRFTYNQAKGTLRRTSQAPGKLVRFRGLGLDGQTSVWTTVGASDLSNIF